MPAPEGTLGQRLTDAGKDGLVDLTIGYVTAGLGDFLYATTDLPQFLADPNPPVIAAQPLKQITRAACRSYARGGGPQNLPGFDAVWGGICDPYLKSIGEDPTPGSLARPFNGGQCPVRYFVQATWQNRNTSGELGAPQNQNVTSPLGRPGPIVSLTREGVPGSWQLVLTHGTDATFTSPRSVVRSSTSTNSSFENIAITSVTRVDGLADSCGNPPPNYNPPKIRPGLPTLPPTTPVDFPGIGPVGVDVTFDPDGTININLPDIGVEVGIEDPFGLGGDDSGGGAPPGPPPGDVGSPGSPVAVGPGGDAEGEAPPGSVLVGLRVQITAFPPSRNKYTDTVFRGAYYAYMGVPGLLDLDFGGSMVRADQFLFAEKDNLTSWRVSANTGYELITTPYYREVEA